MRDCDIKSVNKEIISFGDPSLFSKMPEKYHSEERVMQNGVPFQESNCGYDPTRSILELFVGVWRGASCFSHPGVVRYDAALCDLSGWKHGADRCAYQHYLNKSSQAINQRIFGNLSRWFFSELKFDNYILDFDSTMMIREGNQEGAAKGYNPRRPGRLSYHPLLVFVSDVRMMANYWLRPGNTSVSTNYLSFLEDILSILEGKHIRLVRVDSGFFTKEIPDYLEDKGLHYTIACRFNNHIKYNLTRERKWIELINGLEIPKTIYQANSWEKPGRIVMVRQKIKKRPKAAGKQTKQMDLLEDEEDFRKYRYSCFVADLDLSAKIVYDSYRGRADSESRIKELENDFSTDNFVTHNFWATEACESFIVMAYSFMSLSRHTLANSNKKRFLKTIRYELLSAPAYLRGTKDKHILYLVKSLKTRQSFLSVWKKLKDFSLPYDTEKPQ